MDSDTTAQPPPAAPSPEPLPDVLPDHGGGTWHGTRTLIASDWRALLKHLEVEHAPWFKRVYWMLLPSFLGLVLYRLSHWAYRRGWRNLGRAIFLLKVYLTRMEIAPTTVIGPGLVISHASGVNLDGHIGARCLIFGQCNTGRSFGRQTGGTGSGLPVIGDDVTIGYGAMVLGGIRVGDGARIGPGTIVTSSVPPGALVMWAVPRMMLASPASRTDTD